MSEPEVDLSPDAQRALREAQNLCWRANVAIVAAEHVLAGALVVLAGEGGPGLPPAEAVAGAMVTSQGSGSTTLSDTMMFGSSARDAISAAAVLVRAEGRSTIDARLLARATVASGEVSPGFYASLGTSQAELLAVLTVPA
ncbi:MAG: hypothetical protein IT304_05790 [Dehalococcoidia bacterium]|nr:hypothetical protein [Dehalococcoidia bacterium]